MMRGRSGSWSAALTPVEGCITFGRTPPAHIRCHRIPLQAGPSRLVLPQSCCSHESSLEHQLRHGCKLDSSRDTSPQSHLVRVNDGVGQPSDTRHDRNGTISERAELCETTRLKPRRNEQGVAPTLYLVSQGL